VVLLLGVTWVPTLYLAGVVPAISLLFCPSVVANFPTEAGGDARLGGPPDRQWSAGAANSVIIALHQMDTLSAELATSY